MRLAENTRRAVAAEGNRVILRRLLPPDLADGDPTTALALITRPRNVEATVLVSDLRGFTAAVEKLEPHAALAFLNEIQGRLADCVRARGGRVDKFMGDGMLAVFGALDPLPDHAGAALGAAADIRAAVARLNSASSAAPAGLRVGVGIHSGLVVVGCVGSGERLEFTVIGDTVNTASRIEAATKDHEVDILVSETTHSLARTSDVALVPVGELLLRGRQSPLRAYRLETY
jgi:class 3 adenylate cyclase